MRRRRAFAIAVLTACLLTPAAASANGGKGNYARPNPGRTTPQRRTTRRRIQTNYKLNGQAFEGQFGWNPGDAKRMLQVEVHHPALPGGKDLVPTHLFKNPQKDGAREPTIIPAHDDLGQIQFANTARSGRKHTLVRGDAELAKHLKPGEFGFLIHQRQANQEYAGGKVDMTAGGGFNKELTKLWDTHISIPVGVRRKTSTGNKKAGVITLNMPQGYPGGDFGAGRFGLYEGGQWAYGNLTLVKPKFPSYIGKSQKRAFAKNMRTMLAGFNAVANFPGDYNGGDPLTVKTPAEVRNAVAMMIKGVAGTSAEQAESRRFFQDSNNQIYCAELAYTAMSAALHAPLNDKTVRELGISSDTWSRFKREIGKHNSGQESAFTSKNSAENEMIKHMQIGVSPRNLKAAHEYAPENLRAAESKKMAFGPMTAADIIANALAVQFPRSKWGEQVGSRVQADAWSGMKAGIMSQLQGSGNRSQMTPEQAGQVQQLLDGVGQVIAANHGTYDNFRAAIKPLLDRARALPGLQFVPPHMFHLQAMSKDRTWTSQGLLGLEYGGTVVNAKLLDKVVTSQEVPAGE